MLPTFIALWNGWRNSFESVRLFKRLKVIEFALHEKIGNFFHRNGGNKSLLELHSNPFFVRQKKILHIPTFVICIFIILDTLHWYHLFLLNSYTKRGEKKSHVACSWFSLSIENCFWMIPLSCSHAWIQASGEYMTIYAFSNEWLHTAKKYVFP